MIYLFHLEQTVDVLRHQWAYSCEKAKAELNYSPRSLEEGLTEVLPWLKTLNLINYEKDHVVDFVLRLNSHVRSYY